MKLRLACYFPAERPSFIDLDIDSDASVQKLSEAVYEELKLEDQDVKLRDLYLYKANVSTRPQETRRERALQWLHEQPLQAPLNRMEQLATFFPAAPSWGTLHILIADPSIVDTLGEPDAQYIRRVQKALGKVIDDLSSGNSPSEVVKNTKGVNAFLDPDKGRVYLDRVPVAMFSPPLARLQQHLNGLDRVEVSHTDVERAAQLLGAAIDFFEDEQRRQVAISEDIDLLVERPGKWEESLKWAGNIKPDSIWWHKNFPTILLELENTVGIGGDAILQAIVDYSKIISQDKFKDYRGTCNFPIVLIGFTGNRIQVSAAVCAGTIYVSNLCILDLSSGFHSSRNAVRLACVFKALSLCRTELEAYYDGVPTSRDASSKLSALYPNPTFMSVVEPPSLIYRKFLARTGQPTSVLPKLGNTMTAMYIATLGDSNQEVIVKFTARYNKEAHTLLSNAGFAPKLHFCERIVGDLYMVVMDLVESKSIWQLYKGETGIPTIVADQVESAVDVLHANGIVFGDLRDNNILYKQMDGSAGGKVFLVDFDWADKDGEGRYPGTLNRSGVWAQGVVPYGLMRKAHDIWQVNRLKRRCAQDSA